MEPALPPGTTVTTSSSAGLDGYGAVIQIDDALTDDVLLAEHLDEHPLDSDHRAPVRLVSRRGPVPGYLDASVSAGSRCTSLPGGIDHGFTRVKLRLLGHHPRGQDVARNAGPDLPARVLTIYQALIPPIMTHDAGYHKDSRRGA